MHVARADAGPISWRFACPACRTLLVPGPDEARCPRCDHLYPCTGGIWRLLPEERLRHYEQFLREYRIVREAEGWGRPDEGYFLSLPDAPPGDPQWAVWRRRSESYRLLTASIIEPLAATLGRPLRVLDLGAGNCWLAYRLAAMGHQPAAVDISDHPTDGLGAHVWYRAALERAGRVPLTAVQAELDRLPLPGRAADLTIFNASLHYSTDYGVTLHEALRVLKPEGTLVIMDTPVYRNAAAGEQMVRERERAFERAHGFRSNSLPAEHFLTVARLEELSHDLGLRCEAYVPGVAPALRLRVKEGWRRLRGLRELARMPVIAGRPV